MKKYLVIFLLFSMLPSVSFADDDEDYTEDPTSQWLEAARTGNMVTIKKMLQQGFDIETQTHSGNSALKIASKKNHLKLAKFLIDSHAEVNSRSHKRGSTPLHAATSRGFLDMVNLLLKHGADFNAANHKGNTPLNIAAKKNHPEIIKALLLAGANLEAQNNNGNTPLSQAAKHNSLAATQVLLAHGANPLMVDNNGDNVIQLATGKSLDIILGTVNATSIVFKLPETIDDKTFVTTATAVLINIGWIPEQKKPQELFATLQKNERIFRVHLERISGDNLLIEYTRGYGANSKNFLEHIKRNLLLTLKSKLTGINSAD